MGLAARVGVMAAACLAVAGSTNAWGATTGRIVGVPRFAHGHFSLPVLAQARGGRGLRAGGLLTLLRGPAGGLRSAGALRLLERVELIRGHVTALGGGATPSFGTLREQTDHAVSDGRQ